MHLLQKTVLKYFVNLVNLKIIISLYACETPETNAKWGFKNVQEKKTSVIISDSMLKRALRKKKKKKNG